tara:strand:- start:2477 stop:3766 length:1290 start_codon:yes stop_codon:yes gene_type:complete
MILKDIIEEVNGLLDHNPNVSTHETHVVRLVNRHYEELCSAHPWRFLQERAEQQLYADIEGAAGTTLTLANNSKLVTAAAGAWLHTGMEGAVIEDTTNSVEYRIDSVANTTTAYLAEATGASGALSATTAFKVKWDKIKLPRDMVDFLGITIRDEIFGQAANARDRRLVYVDSRTEEDLLLEHTSSGDTIIITDDDADRTFNNDLTITATVTVGGSLTYSTKYEYCATIEREGIESAPSPVVSGTIAASGSERTITIAGLPAVSGTDVYRKRIYRRNATANTGWYQVYEIVPATSPSTFFNDDGSFPLDYDRPLYYEGPRDTMRLYKRPDADIKCEIRYMRRPPRLVGYNDEPQIPPQYHVILVYKTVADLYLQYGQGSISNIYEVKAQQRIEQMKKRYLDRTDRLYRKGQFQEMPSGYAYLYGDPVKT